MKTNQIKSILTGSTVKIMFLFLTIVGIMSCKKDKTITPPATQADVVITGLSATTGPGLTPVIISGSGFSTTLKDNKVTFNGVVAVVTGATANTLTVTVPLKAGTGPVKVQVGEKIGTGPNFEYVFTYMVSTLAGTPDSYGHKDGVKSSAKFSAIIAGMKVGQDGNIFLADQANHCIRKITPDGTVSTFAGSGNPGLKEGSLLTAEFDKPNDILPGANGLFYVADLNNGRIRKIINGTVSTFAGSTFGNADGQGEAAKFSLTSRIASDKEGNVYVADDGNYNIKKITSSGMVTTLAGGSFGYADGKGVAAKFSFQYGGIITDSKGNLYMSDVGNQSIRKITPDGTVSTYLGVKGEGGVVNGELGVARTKLPGCMVIDANDNIYFNDGPVIRKITPAGFVSTVAGAGVEGVDDGPALTAKFKLINGIAISLDGLTIYVSDLGSGTIRKIEAQ